MRRKFLALVVPRRSAQRTLQKAVEAGLLDRRRKVVHNGGSVEIPVTADLSGHQVIEQRAPQFYRSEPELADFLGEDISPGEMARLPRGWDLLGKVITVKIDPGIEHLKEEIGDALLEIYPRCSCVLMDLGIEGRFREPRREVIAGAGTETTLKENGVIFKLDAMRIMFSSGNLCERMRMSAFGKGEFVVDMFAGIGYFSLPMAVHSCPEKVLSIELNPVSHRYLVENVRLNRVEGVVEPVLGDCSQETPEGVADRVVMGYVRTTDHYLDVGIRALRPGGILHYHQTVPEWLYPDSLIGDVELAARLEGRRAEVLRCARVKKYSPGMLHAVLDARIV